MMTIVPFDEYERAQASQRPASKIRFNRINTNDLMAKTFDPLREIVPGLIVEGFTVLAGRQKLGKTWLGIDIALAVASGGMALGSLDCKAGDVLYLDLENGQRRIQRRIDAIYPRHVERPDLSRLEWVTDAPALDKGLIEALDDWRQSVPKPRLIIIDVLQRVKPAGNAARNSYENDYSAWAPLQRWATENGIAVIGLHHTRKGGADDPLEALSGSNGLSAVADATMLLDRDGNGITLYLRGRDIEEKELALTFLSGIWSIAGDAAKVRMTAERAAILDALLDSPEPMSPTDIAAATRMSNQNVRQTLSRMARAGDVIKAGYGRYRHPDHQPSTPCHTGHTVTLEDEMAGNPRPETDP